MKPQKLLLAICIIANCLLPLLPSLLGEGFGVRCFAQGTWAPKAPLPAAGRITAVAFTIGTKGYLGTGQTASSNFLDDFWEYDPLTNIWTQKANFGGAPRGYAVGFSIGSYGYIGTGINGGGSFNDFWKYDPIANTWIQVANVGGPLRGYAVGFSIASRGYIATGGTFSGLFQDLWEYDPVSNTWAPKANYVGGNRSDIDRAVFVICDKAYMGTGKDGIVYYNDFWEYDPLANGWIQKANFPGTPRYGATGFSIGNRGFLGLGRVNTVTYATDFWKYNPITNSWSAATAFPGGGRIDQPVFVINNKAYVGTGLSNSGFYNDLWEFTPDSVISVGNVTAVISSSSDTICLGQSVTLSASGGSSYSWSNGSTNNPIVVFPTVTTTYSVSVSDVCGSDTAAVTISVASAIILTTNGITDVSCNGGNDGSAAITVNGGTSPYLYNWSPSGGTNPAATGLSAGAYLVTVIDANGCKQVQTITIADPASVLFAVPNAFSPNSDGENDVFCIQGDNYCINELKIIIYDRWGEKVYESSGKNFCWDGIHTDFRLNPIETIHLYNTAVFVYYLKITLQDGKEIIRKGNISLIR